MIKLNNELITPKYFSDATLDIKMDIDILNKDNNIIEWYFDNNEELIVLYFVTRYIQSKAIDNIDLFMPYIPNARKDRAQRSKDVFSLKYFSEIINNLNFKNVYVLDPHSIVSEALIDRIRIITPEKYILRVLDKLDASTIMFYPDEGAMKRYSGKFDKEFTYGIKVRDKETRVINSLQIEGDLENIKDKDILMVDDICASGKTLCIAAKKLKELGAKNIYVYVSHLENHATNSELLEVINKLYTTNSLFRNNHPKIEIIEISAKDIS